MARTIGYIFGSLRVEGLIGLAQPRLAEFTIGGYRAIPSPTAGAKELPESSDPAVQYTAFWQQ